MAKKHRAEHHEEHMDETWLIPYADLLTLLLALFIVLYSSAQVDQKKFDQIRQAFSVAFSNGSPDLLNSMKTVPQVTDGTPTTTPLQNVSESTKNMAYMQENEQLVQAKKVIDKYIADNNLTGELSTVLTEEGLMIRIKDTALFQSGSADLLSESRRFGAEIAKMLLVLPQKVVISGHTDTIPINTKEFPSNWDLSSKRALNFMRFLLTQEKLQPERFSAIGYGEYRPVTPNITEDDRSKNRRVEILIMRNVKLTN